METICTFIIEIIYKLHVHLFSCIISGIFSYLIYAGFQFKFNVKHAVKQFNKYKPPTLLKGYPIELYIKDLNSAEVTMIKLNENIKLCCGFYSHKINIYIDKITISSMMIFFINCWIKEEMKSNKIFNDNLIWIPKFGECIIHMSINNKINFENYCKKYNYENDKLMFQIITD